MERAAAKASRNVRRNNEKRRARAAHALIMAAEEKDIKGQRWRAKGKILEVKGRKKKKN